MKKTAFFVSTIFLGIFGTMLFANDLAPDSTNNIDSQVKDIRIELKDAMKDIVKKVFADNIDVTASKAPNPYKPIKEQTSADYIEWGEWIIKIAGLDRDKWKALDNGIYLIDSKGNNICGESLLLWINTSNGNMIFSPSKLVDTYDESGFCKSLRESYESKDREIPIIFEGVVEFY